MVKNTAYAWIPKRVLKVLINTWDCDVEKLNWLLKDNERQEEALWNTGDWFKDWLKTWSSSYDYRPCIKDRQREVVQACILIDSLKYLVNKTEDAASIYVSHHILTKIRYAIYGEPDAGRTPAVFPYEMYLKEG